MIFTPELAEKIIDGRKTVTRRPAANGPCATRVGSMQKIQPGQGQPALPGQILIRSIRLEAMGSCSTQEARAEGFGGRFPLLALLAEWERIYGEFPKPTRSVYRIEVEYIAP